MKRAPAECAGFSVRARPIQILVGCGLIVLLSGCSRPFVERRMEVTAYCPCGECCGWTRGSWRFLKLNFWSKYVTAGSRKGERYTGRTASGSKPRPVQPGLFSMDSLTHPWRAPFRLLLPWKIPPRAGTLAADTAHHPFGTRMYVPGYGWGVVEDRGSAIKGPDRLDVFISSHRRTVAWGRKRLDVRIAPGSD